MGFKRSDDKYIPKEEWAVAFVMLSYMQDTSRVPLQAAHIVEKSTAREDRILRLSHITHSGFIICSLIFFVVLFS